MEELIKNLAALNIQHSLDLPDDPDIRRKYGAQARVLLDEKSWTEIAYQLAEKGFRIVEAERGSIDPI